jgi:molybdopterin converting factor subunit 1
MSIRVLFFASLADVTGVRETELDSSPFSDVSSVFENFVREFPALEAHRSSLICAVNLEFAKPDSPVHDGDEIAFFPPVSGGCDVPAGA